MQAVLLEGKTYIHKSNIKRIGGKWQPDALGWVVPLINSPKALELASTHNLKYSIIDVDPEDLETPTGERLRAIRQTRINKRASNMRTKADKLEREATDKQAKMNAYHGDISFFSQPANANSSFSKYRSRICESWFKGCGLQVEADNLREQADDLTAHPAVIKGDKKNKDVVKRQEIDKKLKLGDQVLTLIYGAGLVVKINPKTVRIKIYRTSNTLIVDKIYIEQIIPVEEK